jgi:CheY-like chemotaxis protein
LRQGEAVPPEAPAASHRTRGGTELVVVAEDDETVAKVVVQVLTGQGYSVALAADGARALEICLEQRDGVDLLVTDVVMPRMNGPELVRALRAKGVHVPVLFMSGYTPDELVTVDAEGGQLELLEKPFTATDLLARVREALDGRLPRTATE